MTSGVVGSPPHPSPISRALTCSRELSASLLRICNENLQPAGFDRPARTAQMIVFVCVCVFCGKQIFPDSFKPLHNVYNRQALSTNTHSSQFLAHKHAYYTCARRYNGRWQQCANTTAAALKGFPRYGDSSVRCTSLHAATACGARGHRGTGRK